MKHVPPLKPRNICLQGIQLSRLTIDREVKLQLTGRRRSSALDCNAISEEEEEDFALTTVLSF
jgi:hypothetical protein